MRKSVLILLLFLPICAFGQTETLTNANVIEMARAGLSAQIIINKINESDTNFDSTTSALIELKKAGLEDYVIVAMMERQKVNHEKKAAAAEAEKVKTSMAAAADTKKVVMSGPEALKSARTVAIEKSSIHPSRQALEKELLKRSEWKGLNLNIVRQRSGSDLYIEIGRVPLSWVTHRYVFRVYDTRSGTVIAAGETTSWGSLAENMAREIAKKLVKASISD